MLSAVAFAMNVAYFPSQPMVALPWRHTVDLKVIVRYVDYLVIALPLEQIDASGQCRCAQSARP